MNARMGRVAGWLIVALAALPLGGCSYNRFVSQEETIKTQWAQVENQLQRRNDLIPNLVETVKGYMAHEKQTLERVIQARNAAAGALRSRPPIPPHSSAASPPRDRRDRSPVPN